MFSIAQSSKALVLVAICGYRQITPEFSTFSTTEVVKNAALYVVIAMYASCRSHELCIGFHSRNIIGNASSRVVKKTST